MKLFYPKFALDAIRKNHKSYIPFILTTALMVAMFHIIITLAGNPAFDGTFGDSSLEMLLGFGIYVIAVFSLIFLFYTSSFIMSQRRQEFGLYSVLGLGKRHITVILFYETLFAAAIGIFLGLLVGALLNWAAYLILLNMLGLSTNLPFSLREDAMRDTVSVYLGIFLLIFLWNALRLWCSSTLSLMNSSREGEKEPKARWAILLLGAVFLAVGYGMALSIKNPVGAFVLFFVAVIFVILGTYFLFTAGSIALLKLLRKNKKYYYKTNHFISVSGMLYRMKQNAVSLGNICILSTMVLVTISSTMSLYVGCNHIIEERYPRELNLSIWSSDVTPKTTEFAKTYLIDLMEKHGAIPRDQIQVSYLSFGAMQQEDQFITNTVGATLMDELSGVVAFTAVSLTDYNATLDTPVSLRTDEILVYTTEGYDYDTVSVLGKTYTVREQLKDFAYESLVSEGSVVNFIVIVPEKELSVLYQLQRETYGELASNIYTYCGYNVGDEELAAAITDDYSENMYVDLANMDLGEDFTFWSSDVENRYAEGEAILEVFAGLFFVGIFLGLLFLMATILIIYYKQLAEGIADRNRYSIMQKVGLTKGEIRKSIRSQVLTMFFLPLITAFVHTAFAFPMINRLLRVLNMTSTSSFIYCLLICCGIFGVMYFIVYGVTSRVYYDIVNE